ncbi:unnamed protein product [Effrenium voratum]|nr:unnamed protein product [Effrenium voratum]
MAVSSFLAFLAGLALANGAEPAGITSCTSGAEDILGSRSKAFAVQICNLFGATCFVNHPAISDCATEALSIADQECKLYPIFEYSDNAVRSGSSAVEELSTIDDLDCTVSGLTSSGATYSGACVAVRCEVGSSHVGLGIHLTSTLTGTHTRDSATSDTSANMHAVTIGSLASSAAGLKTAFLYRTGSYAGVYKVQTVASGDTSLTIGDLPSSMGSSLGPVACPSPNQLMTSGTATAITAENLRMCGATDAAIQYHAVNLITDYNSHSASATGRGTLGATPYLSGSSIQYTPTSTSNHAIDLTVMGASAFGMNSQTIVPGYDGASAGQSYAGTYRAFGVVFYCADRARTDLTSCPVADRKMFYVADPNPNAVFGADASMSGTTTTTQTSSTATTMTSTMTATMTTTATTIVGSGQAGGAPRQILAWSCLGAVLLSA